MGDNDGGDEYTASVAVGGLVAALAVISVALRFYSRHITATGFKWDDWLVLLALATTLTSDILVLYSSGINPNGAEVASNTDPNYVYTPEDIEYNKLTFIATVIYFTIVSATKLSILFMYQRLFWINTSFRRQVIVVSVIVLGFWIGTTVSNLLNCIPIEWSWRNSLDDPRYCFNYNNFWLASGVVEAIIDIIIIVMPIRVVLKLHLDKSKKIAIAGVFLLGAFVILSGIVKVILSYEPGNREPSFARTAVWSTVHIGTGIVCASLPVCWPFFVGVVKYTKRRWSALSCIGKRGYDRNRLSSMERSKTPMKDIERNISSPQGNYELHVRSVDSGVVLGVINNNPEER
ncbi:hypothetical protein HD806DRAFT_211358 [Xylariaceae sp. AK1471]|nr:hypothetical protein HD806DRAFT_211358 [Xylariaceae sp. AK1471]